MRRVVMLVVLVLLVLPVHVHAATAPSLASLNLRRADVPANLTYVTIADLPGSKVVADDSVPLFPSTGRKGLTRINEIVFSRNSVWASMPTKPGVNTVVFSVAQYAQTAAAHAAYARMVAPDGPLDPGTRIVNGGTVGSERTALIQDSVDGSGGDLIFRRGAYLGTLWIFGRGPMTVAQMIHYAAIVDTRIKAVH